MKSDLKHLPAELEASLDGADAEALEKAPAGKWTSTQILEHRYLTYKAMNKAIAKCLESGTPLATSATLKQRLQTFVVTRLGYLPEGAKAPERAVPRGLSYPGLSHKEVREIIFSELEKMAAGLDDCEKRFGATTKIIDHPIVGPLTADEWRKFHWLHGSNHARQIRERTKL